jgi:hypothetical protein
LHGAKKSLSENSNRLLLRTKYESLNYLTAFVVSAATAEESAATVSTATTVESALGASSAFLGAQDAKAKATTQNKNTFFITLNL